MEFDKSKVFSPVNAEELRIGDQVIVADCMAELWDKVRRNVKPREIIKIKSGEYLCRFVVKEDTNEYTLAYLVERAEETKPRYRPFRDTDELIQAWCDKGGKWQKRELTMPFIWVKFNEKYDNRASRISKAHLIHGFYHDYIEIQDRTMNMRELLDFCNFLNGSPCGVEVKE